MFKLYDSHIASIEGTKVLKPDLQSDSQPKAARI